MSTEDGERSGHPKGLVTDENIKKIHKMISNGRKLKLNEIADTLKISTERVHHIIHKYLGMRELCAKWVPRELTFDQKQHRVDDSEQCLKMIKCNKSKKKVLPHQDNASCYKAVKTMAKIHELGFELLPHLPYSSDLSPSEYFLFSDLKRMLAGNKGPSNKEVIAETEAYFQGNDKS
ncbi:hypothetical protein GWI33_019150 [Rhynchophorus ferrugineus]|uniref:Histone-lysine N-methyltransferase SETMAR n=1 Tax=Rhynchophorus ferrugineus TaxID=354439 RepID=A0A834HS11_RHYFE|nr:hypothetical protein GWI33_019150 [Rhynchophorus ferrugineus]